MLNYWPAKTNAGTKKLENYYLLYFVILNAHFNLKHILVALSSSLSSFIAKRDTERQHALPHDNRVSLRKYKIKLVH